MISTEFIPCHALVPQVALGSCGPEGSREGTLVLWLMPGLLQPFSPVGAAETGANAGPLHGPERSSRTLGRVGPPPNPPPDLINRQINKLLAFLSAGRAFPCCHGVT